MNPKSDYQNFLQSNKKIINDKKTFIVVAFYKFFELINLIDFQKHLKNIFDRTSVKGINL